MMTYPKVFLRIIAMILDSTLVGLLLWMLVLLSAELRIENVVLKIIFIFLPILLFEPMMVSLTGGSIGHHYKNLKIVNLKNNQNLSFFKSIVRFVIKLILGIFSFILVLITKKHQAIHDYLAGSVVTFKNDISIPENFKLTDRKTIYRENKPTILRRMTVIFAYFVVWTILVSFLNLFFIPSDCSNFEQCTKYEEKLMLAIGLTYIVGIILLFILGLFSKLPGAFYKKLAK